MINLKDALLTDGLPDVISQEPWARGMAAAVRSEMRKILEYAKLARIYAAVDIEPEKVIDIMAFDLRVHEYKQTYPIETKRALVKTALQRWSRAGTKAAVEDLCTAIFGDAHILEWYEYGGNPHFFKVTCSNAAITEQDLTDFKRAVASIKRLSSWLENIELVLSVPALPEIHGFSVYTVTQENLKLMYNVLMKAPKFNFYKGAAIFDTSRSYFTMEAE